MKDKVDWMGARDFESWKETIVKTWISLDQNFEHNFVHSLRKRFELCIEANGDVIKY